MKISQNRTKRTQIAMMIRHADDHLPMTTAEAVTRQAVVAAKMMMEEKTVAEGEVKDATTLVENRENTVTGRGSGNDDRVCHVPLQGGDVERNVDASLLVDAAETPACQKIDILLVANTDSES